TGSSYSTTVDFGKMGRRLKDEIMSMTKDVISRALSGVDVQYDLEIDGKRYSNASGVDMAGADLSGEDYSDQDLRRANFSGAHLKGGKFNNANLYGANLSG